MPPNCRANIPPVGSSSGWDRAVEDGAVLAKGLADGGGDTSADIAAALKRYAQLRRARVAKVQRAARQAGRIYHLTGPAAVARDFAIKALGPQRMLARQDWI